MNRKHVLTILAALALTLTAMPVSAFSSPTVVEYKAHDTGTEFSNAQMLQNLKVKNGNVTLGPGTTKHYEGFEDDGISDWTVFYDNPSVFSRGSELRSAGSYSMLYRPGSQEWDNMIIYNDFHTDGETGTMSMNGLIYIADLDDGTYPHGAFELVDQSSGAYYRLDLVDPSGSGDFRLGYSNGGKNSGMNWLTGTFGDYLPDTAIKMEIRYDYSSNTLTAVVYGENTITRQVSTNAVPHPDGFAVSGAGPGGSGSDYFKYDNFTLKSGVPQSAEYISQAYNIDNPTAATVTVDELAGGNATIQVLDGDGTVLGSKTVSSAGQYKVSLDPTKQSDSTARVQVQIDDTGSAGDLAFTMSREAVQFEDDPPGATLVSPNDGETVYTNTPKLTVDVTDEEFGLAQDETVTVEWYVDGSKVAEKTVNSPGQVSYEVSASLAEGQHDWYARVVDKYGGEGSTTTDTFTVDHKAPIIDNSSADPSGGEKTPYASNTLSINVSDYDFAHDGDTLTVGWYVNGTLVHENKSVSSNGTVSYTTDKLAEGQHNWYVKVGDSWGDTVTSDTFTYEIKHFAPTVSNPSIDGKTYYENNTLAVDIGDRDFAASGDTVTVGIYVDGAKEYETTISSNQTVSFDAGPYADGSYTWHVEAADTYGYKTVSPKWDLNITHGKTGVSNPSIDGVTHYENNTLAVSVSDADFPRDGDTVDVGFYVNGTLNHTETISSNQTVGYEVGPWADGSYTWHVEAVDDYGHRTVSNTWDLKIDHAKPGISNPSIDGITHYENNTLAVDVSDADFSRDGDTVEVGFYINGTLNHTETISSAQRVSYQVGPWADGSYTWHVEAVDDYGHRAVSNTWNITIQHARPTPDLGSLSPTATINYENANLSVYISDPDFPRDGDTVDIAWYVDGYHLHTDTITSNGTYNYVTPPLVDGNHTWRVVLYDDYGYVTGISNETFTVKHFPTQIDNSTAVPQGTITDQTPTFKVDISDRDFAIDGDSVDMGLYVNGTLIGVDTLYQNGTAKVTPVEALSGDKSYYWKAVGSYGHVTYSANFTINPPNSLYLYSVVDPYKRLNNTAALSVITGSNETTDLDRITDGSVEFGDIPKSESYVFSLTADGYYQRGVHIENLYSKNALFMIPGSQEIVTNTIRIQDSTGKFRENPIINIETVINTSKVPQMPDNGPQWVVVGGDRLGAANEYTAILREGGRYRFTVENHQGDTRTLGFYTAKQKGLIVLEIGEISYPAVGGKGYTWDAYTNDTDGPGGTAMFAYKDTTNGTENVSVTMKVRDTGRVIGQETLQAGTYGEAVITFPVGNETFRHKDIVVSWTAYKNGSKITGKRIISGQDYNQNVPLGSTWLKIVYGLLIILLAFVAGSYLGASSVFIVLGLGAGLGTLAGIAPTALGAGVTILTIGLGATMKRWQSTQPK